jgi:1,5-anhydro-D-fructose reductase (1,5-anhydro-D-mannitol-forming)
MSPIEANLDNLADWAARYAATSRQTRLRVGPASLGWGVLGASAVAEQHFLPALRRQPPAPNAPDQAGAWAAAIFSHNERRAARFADLNQLPTTAVNLTDLLERRTIQCVYISSHPRHHAPLIMAALAAGKHVLCEPPMALSAPEAQTLVLAAADRGLVLAVNFAARGNPAVQTLRRLIQEHALGDILSGRISNLTLLPPHRQTWRLQANGGGILFDRTLHSLDLARFLLAEEMALVYAAAGPSLLSQTTGGQLPEEVVGYGQLARRRTLIQFHDAWSIAHRPAILLIDGTHGSATVEQWTGVGGAPSLSLRRLEQSSAVPLPVFDPFWLAIHQFQQAIAGNAAPLASGDDGLRALILAEALMQSIRDKAPVQPGRIDLSF